MAKNTRSAAFRKIDVDEFNEDNYKEDEGAEHSSETAPDEREIFTLVERGRLAEALQSCLKNAPLGSKSIQVKDQAFSTTLRVLMAIKSSQMDEIVSKLDVEEVDVLMKYIYRGFEQSSEGQNSQHLLTWHEKTFSAGGIGSITRVLTDRRKV